MLLDCSIPPAASIVAVLRLWHIHGVIPLVVFLFGLVIGSFLNVCILRIPADKSIVLPASSCPKCGKAIAPYDNIPPRIIQLRTGILSYGAIALPHLGQLDAGRTIDLSAGMRRMHTFRKLPTTRPNKNAPRGITL